MCKYFHRCSVTYIACYCHLFYYILVYLKFYFPILEDFNVSLKDKTIKKFFNAKAYEQEKDVAIKSFLRYINSREVSDDFTDRIETFIKDIKSKEVNRKEYSTVNIHDQDIYFKAKNEGIKQGISQDAQEKAIETAKTALSLNLPLEQIAKLTGLSEEEIKNLQ